MDWISKEKPENILCLVLTPHRRRCTSMHPWWTSPQLAPQSFSLTNSVLLTSSLAKNKQRGGRLQLIRPGFRKCATTAKYWLRSNKNNVGRSEPSGEIAYSKDLSNLALSQPFVSAVWVQATDYRWLHFLARWGLDGLDNDRKFPGELVTDFDTLSLTKTLSGISL